MTLFSYLCNSLFRYSQSVDYFLTDAFLHVRFPKHVSFKSSGVRRIGPHIELSCRLLEVFILKLIKNKFQGSKNQFIFLGVPPNILTTKCTVNQKS
jgi:hypothetical protein